MTWAGEDGTTLPFEMGYGSLIRPWLAASRQGQNARITATAMIEEMTMT
jgi:hypothetical protein